MLDISIDHSHLIAELEPQAPVTAQDFRQIADSVDPVIEDFGFLRGLIIRAHSLADWQSFTSLCQHIRFVKDHHRRIGRIALVSDVPPGDMTETIARHFVRAEIRQFEEREHCDACAWVAESGANGKKAATTVRR